MVESIENPKYPKYPKGYTVVATGPATSHFGHRDSEGACPFMRTIQHGIVGLALCITAACGGSSSSPTSPTPSIPNVAGTYSGSLTITSSLSADVLTGSARLSVVQAGSQLTITSEITFLGETLQLPAVTGTINATGFFTATGGGGVTSESSGECGTFTTTSSTLTFSGNSARYVETVTTQYCGSLSLAATLFR